MLQKHRQKNPLLNNLQGVIGYRSDVLCNLSGVYCHSDKGFNH